MTQIRGFVLCADIGTTSLKAGIFDSTGKTVCRSRQRLAISDPSLAASAWLPALLRAANDMRNELAARPSAEGGNSPLSAEGGNSPLSADGRLSVCALSISGNGPTIVSETGRTLLWNAPSDAGIGAESSKTKSLFAPRLAAFKARYADDWQNSARIFSGAEWLVFQLTGSAATVLPEARYEEAYWRRKDLEAFGIEAEKLPGFVPVGWNAGNVLPEQRAALHLKESAPVFCGGPDFIAAMIGTGSLRPGRMYDRAGSSEGINLCVERPLSASGLRTLPSVMPGLWNISALLPESGSRFDAYRDEYRRITGAELSYDELIDNSLADKNSEGWRILSELAADTASAVEAVRAAADAESLPFPSVMTATGGQAQHRGWLSKKATATGMAIAVGNTPDAELLGDAIVAHVGLGIYRNLTEAADAMTRQSEPIRPERAEAAVLKQYRVPRDIRTIIFDIDSTLYTNEAYAVEQVDVQLRCVAESRGWTAAEARIRVGDFRRRWSLEHGGKKISLGNALTRFGVTIDESIAMRRRLLEPARFLSRDETLAETLAALQKHFRLICVTNNPVLPAEKTLSALGVREFFTDVIGLDTCGKSKPAEEPFLLAAELTGATAERCLSVGDRYDMDIALPLSLGMGGILVSGVAAVYRLPELLCPNGI